jgi:hypothetical protein
MADISEQQKNQTDKSESHNNMEMNSSETGGGTQNNKEHGDNTWRDSDVNEESGDPGRTPGSAEGEDDPEYTGS